MSSTNKTMIPERMSLVQLYSSFLKYILIPLPFERLVLLNRVEKKIGTLTAQTKFAFSASCYAVTTLILNLCDEIAVLRLCQSRTYISTLRAVEILPRSIMSRQPNQSRKIITTVALASISLPLTKTTVFSINLDGLIITLALTVLRVLTTFVSGKARWICSPKESVLHTVNVQVSVERSSGFEVSIKILPFRFPAPARFRAFKEAEPNVQLKIISPNSAAFMKVPYKALRWASFAHATALGFAS